MSGSLQIEMMTPTPKVKTSPFVSKKAQILCSHAVEMSLLQGENKATLGFAIAFKLLTRIKLMLKLIVCERGPCWMSFYDQNAARALKSCFRQFQERAHPGADIQRAQTIVTSSHG